MTYKRVLLKLSGEALMGDLSFGINREVMILMVDQIKRAFLGNGIQLAIVIGGGNFFRGVSTMAMGINRATADYMGMLATLMNALALRDCLESQGLKARIQSALSIPEVAEPYTYNRAMKLLEQYKILIFATGLGSPFFTTDTAAALRSVEMGVDLMIKATKVDGVYDKDPNQNVDAIFYKRLSFDDLLERNLQVMDHTALTLCKEHNLSIRVLSIFKDGALERAITGEDEGTLICE